MYYNIVDDNAKISEQFNKKNIDVGRRSTLLILNFSVEMHSKINFISFKLISNIELLHSFVTQITP